MPLQAPPQPVKEFPVLAEAVRVTAVPSAKPAEHSTAGRAAIDPARAAGDLAGAGLADRQGAGDLGEGAVTPCAAVIVTVQPPVPLHPPPDQPAKIDPGAAFWVRVTTVPCWKFAEHTAPQVIPEGCSSPCRNRRRPSIRSMPSSGSRRTARSRSAPRSSSRRMRGAAATAAPTTRRARPRARRRGQGDLGACWKLGRAGRAALDPRGAAATLPEPVPARHRQREARITSNSQ